MNSFVVDLIISFISTFKRLVISWSIKQFGTNCRLFKMGRVVAFWNLGRIVAQPSKISLLCLKLQISNPNILKTATNYNIRSSVFLERKILKSFFSNLSKSLWSIVSLINEPLDFDSILLLLLLYLLYCVISISSILLSAMSMIKQPLNQPFLVFVPRHQSSTGFKTCHLV